MTASRIRPPILACILAVLLLVPGTSTGLAGTSDTVLFAPVTSIPAGGGASLEVANPSNQAVIAAAMLFAEPIACPPYSGGVVRVWCSEAIAPQGSWTFPANALSGTSSAVLLGLSTATGPDGRPIGELACDSLAGALGVDPSGTYRRVRLALETGMFEGTPLEGAIGPALAATVVRQGAELTSGTATHPALGRADTATEHVIPGLRSRSDGGTDFLYVQNAGLRCASIDVALDTGEACITQDLPAGGSRVIDVGGCAPDARSDITVTLSSTEPVAVVRETLLGSVPRRPLAARPDRLQAVPPPHAGTLVWLPALAAAPDGMSCAARLQVTHPGATGPGAVAVLLLHGADAFCPPQSPGPSQVECSGLLRPGGSWDFLLPERNGWGSDATSAVVLSFSDSRLAQIGQPANRDDLIASAMCSIYHMWVVGNPDNARRARLAFQSGSAFRGTPQAAAVGPALTAVVQRTCGSDRPGIVTTTYAGLPAPLLTTLATDETSRPYRGDLPVLAAAAGDTTVLYVQNAGIRCTSVEVRLSDGTVLREPSLAPDETLVVDLAASLGGPLTGLTGRISSDEPLAVIAESYDAAATGGPTLGAGPDPVEDPGGTSLARTTWLPVLRYVGWEDRCEAYVQVENPAAGGMPAVAILVAAGEWSFCPPQAAGPLKVECTGLIRPGGSWLLHGEQIPSGAYGAAVWSFRSETASQLGVQLTEVVGLELAEDDTVADWMCESLFFGAVGDADDYRRFLLAYESGLDWLGVPMDAIAGPPLRVAVRRACQGPEPSGETIETHYAGIGPADLGTVGADGSHRLALDGLAHDPEGLDSALYLQNAGHRCASIEISFSNGRECVLASLPPLETRFVHVSACAGDGADPVDAVVVSSEPLAAVVETDADSDGMGDVADRPPEVRVTPEPKAGTMVHLPVLSTFGHERGCNAVVQVTNPGGSSGPAIAVMVEWAQASPCREVPEGPELVECSGLIRPGGSWSFPAPGDLSSNPGSAAVYSFSTRSTTEIGPSFVADTAGDYLCEALFFGTIGNEDGYRAFRQAFEVGAKWKDADLRLAAGPALQVAVARTCGRDPVHADSYAGLTVEDLATRQPDGTWLYSRGGLRGRSDDHGSILYVQNAGFGSAAVEARSSDGDVCPLPSLGAGAAFSFYVEDCTGEGFAGTMSLFADQPLAVVAETLAEPLPARPAAPRGFAAEVIGGLTVRLSWWAGDESEVSGYRVLRQRQGGEMEVVTEPPVEARHAPSTQPCYVVEDRPGVGSYTYYLEVTGTDGSTSMPLRTEARVGSGPSPTERPPTEPTPTPSGEPRPLDQRLFLPWAER